MTTDSASWYIPGAARQPTGPFTAEQIIQSLRGRKISASTLCWREGMTQWLPLSQVAPFASVIQAASEGVSSQGRGKPVPVPPLPRIATSSPLPPEPLPKRSRVPIISLCVGSGVGVLVLALIVAVVSRSGRTTNDSGGHPTSPAPRNDPATQGSIAAATSARRAGDVLKYLPDDTIQIVSFDIPNILKSGTYRKFEKVFGGGPNRTWTLGEIEQGPLRKLVPHISRITFALWPAPGGEIMVVMLGRAIQPKEFLTNDLAGGDWAKEDVGGCTFYSSEIEHRVCFFPDDHTLVTGRLKSHLKALLDRHGPPNPSSRASRALRGVDFSHAVTRAQERGNYVPLLEEAILHLCGVTGLDVTLITGSLESTAVYIDDGPNLQVAANWTCRDDESASKVQASMDKLLRTAKAGGNGPPIQLPDGTSLPGTAEARDVLNSIATSRFGRIVVLKFSLNGAFLDLLMSKVDASEKGARHDEPQTTPDDAQVTESTGNLRKIAQAMHQYGQVNRHLPSCANFDAQGSPLLSWRVQLLPYLEEDALYRQFHLNEAWDSEHNRHLVEMMPKVFRNPASHAQPGMANYLAVCGSGLAFNGAPGREFTDFRDGTSNTILVVEADDDKAVPWTKPDDWQFDSQRPLVGLGRAHPDGFNVLFADGSVRLLPKTIDPTFFHALLTVAGGESIGRQGRLDEQRLPTTPQTRVLQF